MFRELKGDGDGFRVPNVYRFDDSPKCLRFSGVSILVWIVGIEWVVIEILLVNREYGLAKGDVFVMTDGNTG